MKLSNRLRKELAEYIPRNDIAQAIVMDSVVHQKIIHAEAAENWATLTYVGGTPVIIVPSAVVARDVVLMLINKGIEVLWIPFCSD